MENEKPSSTEDKSTTGNQIDSQVADPGVESVYQYLMFGLSLPERTVRSTAAMIGGAIDESAALLVPQAFRDSKTYNVFVQQMLDMVSKNVGGVGEEEGAGNANGEGEAATEENAEGEVKDYVAKKTIGTFVDLAGMATMHVSPLTILAIVSDVAYGSKTYLNQLTDELKKEGIIADDSVIANAADLLDAVGKASTETADVFDLPPISVDGLRETIEQTQSSIGDIDPTLLIPLAEIERLWNDMQSVADREDVNIFEISSAMTMYTLDQVGTVTHGALTTIRVTGDLIDEHLFDHYRQSLTQINERGFYAMVAESSQPYLDAVWYNFSTERPTITEDIVSGKMAGRVWSGVKGWFSSSDEAEQINSDPDLN